MYQPIIAATNDAVETDGIFISRESIPHTFVADGLQGSEEIAFYTSADGGKSWTPFNQAGQWVKLFSDDNICSVYAPVPIKLIKSTTTAPTMVGMYYKECM